MYGIQDFSLFLISCILLNLTPGQDTMYIVGRSVAQGKKAGVWSALGIMSGVLIHTLLAALGLSAILATSSLAFSIVKYVGAGYLIWIGIGFMRSGGNHDRTDMSIRTPHNSFAIYRQGVLTNLFNPKVALFFLSFLPQFIDPQVDFVFVAFMLLGMVFFTTGSIWCVTLAIGASWLTDRFRDNTSMGGPLKKLTGILLMGLGVKLAFAHIE
jgi:threonine/homoserine/homoserine lactone efflux protein